MAMSPQQQFNQAAGLVAERLRLFQRTARAARERGEERIELDLREFWEVPDEDALEIFDRAVEHLTGQVRLPFDPTEVVSCPLLH